MLAGEAKSCLIGMPIKLIVVFRHLLLIGLTPLSL